MRCDVSACARELTRTSLPLSSLSLQVETIGDCYMAAAGLVPPRSDNAAVALRFALDMLATAAQVDLGGGAHVELRVGMHAGPVTAGLIGRTRARYCLFGGTVVASRALRSAASGITLTAAAPRATQTP